MAEKEESPGRAAIYAKALEAVAEAWRVIPLPNRWKWLLLLLLVGGGIDRSMGYKMACAASNGLVCPINRWDRLDTLLARTEAIPVIKAQQADIMGTLDSVQGDVRSVKIAVTVVAEKQGSVKEIRRRLHPEPAPNLFSKN